MLICQGLHILYEVEVEKNMHDIIHIIALEE